MTSFARAAFKAEFMTPAGVANVLLMFMALVIVLAAAIADLVQISFRSAHGDYESGPPSFIWFFVIYLVFNLACVVYVGLLTTRRK